MANVDWYELCSQKFKNFVKPIRDRKKIAKIKNSLRTNGQRILVIADRVTVGCGQFFLPSQQWFNRC